MKHAHWLLIYDISEPGRLRNVEKIASRYGVRVQRSVFESDANESMINNLQRRIESIIERNDSFIIIPLCERDWQKAEKYGTLNLNDFITNDYEII